MKPNHLIALAVTAGIVAAVMLAAGCSKTSPSTTPSATATHTTLSEPSHQVSYSSQIVLPFTGLNGPTLTRRPVVGFRHSACRESVRLERDLRRDRLRED
jgi:hypothetical protein